MRADQPAHGLQSVSNNGCSIKPTKLAAVLATFLAFQVALLPQTPAATEPQGSRVREIDVYAALPEALTHPEGRTRWVLDSLALKPGAALKRLAVPSPTPVGELLNPRPTTVDTIESTASGEVTWRAERRRVGLGWLILAQRPYAVVLQRELLSRRAGDDAAFTPHTLVHRWVDPQLGVLLEVRGPLSADGTQRTRVDRGWLVESGPANTKAAPAGAEQRIYVDQLDLPVFTRLAYGYDRGAGTSVSALTPDGHTTIGQLAAASSWDFSGTTSTNAVAEFASTSVPVAQAETCNFDRCGFTAPGAKLSREDKNFDDPETVNSTLSVTQREDRVDDVTLWLRAGVTNDGVMGQQLGEGESRLCFDGAGITSVPLWRFSNQDADGFYMQQGDSWANPPLDCELTIFNQGSNPCPSTQCGVFCQIWTYPCGDLSGTQATEVINEGPVTLPSGHTFNALVLRNVAEFCVSLGSNCTFAVDQVRTVLYLWQVPYLGTVVRLMSDQFVSSTDGFTTVAQTDIKFGLFPPLALSVDDVTDSTIRVSWDPGAITDRIDDYRVYWGTASGASASYAFDSDTHAGQVSFDGTAASISGLDPDTEYFVTVTSRSQYTNPASAETRPYESLLLPLTISGGSGPLPLEVSATTGGGQCSLTTPVENLLVDKVAGGAPGEVEMCWSAAPEICLEGYQILGADDPSAAANFAVAVADTGPDTCHRFSPSQSFFLVVSQGGGSTGPWGHYGM